jgi:hypothetical protein
MGCDALVEVLKETRARLAQPENDFGLSRWKSAAAAVAEVDGILRRISAGETIELFDLEMFFAPTSSLQEVSLHSGWGDDFLRLASRLDAAIADL